MKFREAKFQEIVLEMIRKTEIYTPLDVIKALRKCYRMEKSKLGKFQLKIILDNLKVAEDKQIPKCQDTGVPIFFIKIGNRARINFDIRKSLTQVIKEATDKIPLRRNVSHPITRENTHDNTGLSFPFVWFDYFVGDYVEIDYLPKGGGTENMSVLKMFDSITKFEEVKNFIIGIAIDFLGKCCPPYILGIGIGGSSDIAMHLAKKATMRKIGLHNHDKFVATLERELFEKINGLGIGPMGMGGTSTLYALNIEIVGVHTSVYPVGITNQCWKASHTKIRWRGNNSYEFL